MTEIDELERRIAAALDRIARGVDGLEPPRPDPEPAVEPAPGPEAASPAVESDPEEVAELRAALEEEQTANAQLEERLKGLRSKQEEQVAALEAQVGAGRDGLARLDAELQRLRQANAGLESAVQELTQALAENAGGPELINDALKAELESLRATRAADDAEARAVLDALTPLLAEAAGPDGDADADGERA